MVSHPGVKTVVMWNMNTNMYVVVCLLTRRVLRKTVSHPGV